MVGQEKVQYPNISMPPNPAEKTSDMIRGQYPYRNTPPNPAENTRGTIGYRAPIETGLQTRQKRRVVPFKIGVAYFYKRMRVSNF